MVLSKNGAAIEEKITCACIACGPLHHNSRVCYFIKLSNFILLSPDHAREREEIEPLVESDIAGIQRRFGRGKK
jgi:hypothetical protein